MPMPPLEHVLPEEPGQIDKIIRLTRQQLEKRYPKGSPALRAQHAKAHACVSGTMTVRQEIPQDRRRGVFAHPGQKYDVWVRYSNAAAIPGPDSVVSGGAIAAHASRGMAIKILNVAGAALMPTRGSVDQDFLMVNHPVFPFANVADYEAITQVLADDGDKPDRFFVERVHKLSDGSPDLGDPVTRRTLRTLGIVKRIQSLSGTAQPPAFQRPPACPTDNQYFGGAPFLFGDDKVMRVRVTPTSAASDAQIDPGDRDYLRTVLQARLRAAAAVVAFEFQVQIRDAGTLAVDTDIEDASVDWDETKYPFETLADLIIPPQDFDTAERRAQCEALSFSPWHGISEHRPLGGINRLRRAVYEASAVYRQASSASHR
jgi:hypothetical protein